MHAVHMNIHVSNDLVTIHPPSLFLRRLFCQIASAPTYSYRYLSTLHSTFVSDLIRALRFLCPVKEAPFTSLVSAERPKLAKACMQMTRDYIKGRGF